MANEIKISDHSDAIIKALMFGDLSKLSEQEKLNHYKAVCTSVGLNPLTNPFQYMPFNGKLVLYAGKNTTEQLRSIHKISIKISSRETISDIYIVTATATLKDDRCDESTGAVNIMGLKGEALANAFMKAETKAKRRATLSICGLGMLDESEVDSVPQTIPPVEPNKVEVIWPYSDAHKNAVQAIEKVDKIEEPKEPVKSEPRAETMPICKTCNTVMKISKSEKNYYCPEWKDGREHQPLARKKPKEREVEEQEQPFDELGTFEEFK